MVPEADRRIYMTESTLLEFISRLAQCGDPEKTLASLIKLRATLEAEGCLEDPKMEEIINQAIYGYKDLKKSINEKFTKEYGGIKAAIYRANKTRRDKEKQRMGRDYSYGRC